MFVKSVCLFIFSFFSVLSADLTLNLIGSKNGKGIQTDIEILTEALTTYGCIVRSIDPEDKNVEKADINLFLQGITPEMIASARTNWFIPNPEWYTQSMAELEKMDLILCRTRDSERIFKKLNLPTTYLGFTSPDCYTPHIEKDFTHLLHVAGGSDLKGTDTLCYLWENTPQLPFLTIIYFLKSLHTNEPHLHIENSRISQEHLRQLQNHCGIHICPSEAEGYGHYIMEAMSAACVVITTNAPPMNEFITDKRCTVPYVKSEPLRLGKRYFISPSKLKNCIEAICSLPLNKLKALGESNRVEYLERKAEFYTQLKTLLQGTSQGDHL